MSLEEVDTFQDYPLHLGVTEAGGGSDGVGLKRQVQLWWIYERREHRPFDSSSRKSLRAVPFSQRHVGSSCCRCSKALSRPGPFGTWIPLG